MAEIVWPAKVWEAYLATPEMVASSQAIVDAFVTGSPFLLMLREDDGLPDVVPIVDLYR